MASIACVYFFECAQSGINPDIIFIVLTSSVENITICTPLVIFISDLHTISDKRISLVLVSEAHN
jgi:hypothetical protein